MAMLAGDGNEYRTRLLDGGLYIAPGRRNRDLLTVCLQTVRPEIKALCVSRVGWHGDCFVLPDQTYGPPNSGEVLLQTAGDLDHHYAVSGSVSEWRHHIGRLCAGNSRLVLATSCAFAGPILSLVNAESGGVHFCGLTSMGKTTTLVAGGSVAGGGGRVGFVESWRSTSNGLEAIAEFHNDLPLFLDELAQMDAREASDIAYLLGNGSGKSRMSRSLLLRKRITWNTIFVSAGEVTLADHAQTAGKKTRGGAEVRLLNVPADAGVGMGMFEAIHGWDSPAAFARDLQQAARTYFGSPLRALIQAITQDRVAAARSIEKLRSDFLSRLAPANAAGQVVRAAQRFALIAAAGQFATNIGITGWDNPEEALNAAAICLRAWLDGRGTSQSTDLDLAVRNVRHFLEVHGVSRFQLITNGERPENAPIIRDRAGFRRQTDDEAEYLVLPEVFKREVCTGYNYREVAHELIERGHLVNQPPELTIKTRLPGIGSRRVFAVQSSILEA
jgi:putative DNA primase/helicase